MLDAARILRLHDLATARWHGSTAALPVAEGAFDQLVIDQHRANFDLWHREDEARDPRAQDHHIAGIKHEIDSLNQRRNDLAEQIDIHLLEVCRLRPAQPLQTQAQPLETPAQPSEPQPEVPLHSETPGLIIDRLSILALKIFHTADEVRRPGASDGHHDRNRNRLSVLNEQRTDLAFCLDGLWTEVLAGRRRFKLYRQLKIYNDPSLNTFLYLRSPASTSS